MTGVTRISDCLLCQSTELNPLGIYPVKGIPGFEGTTFELTSCGRCGLVWINPQPNGRLYSILNRRSARFRSPGGVHDSVFQWVLQWLEPRGELEVLEIGCSSGHLISRFASEGHRVCGVDIDEAALQIAKSRIPQGIFITDITMKPQEPAGFDVVLMIQTLEHIPNPLEFLSSIRPFVDGQIFIEVPDGTSPMGFAVVCDGLGCYPSILHALIYTPRTLCNLLRVAGYRVINISTVPGYILGQRFIRAVAARSTRMMERSCLDTRNARAIARIVTKNMAKRLLFHNVWLVRAIVRKLAATVSGNSRSRF